MDLVTLQDWVYPEDLSGSDVAYVPDDAVGRHPNPNITPSPKQPNVYQPKRFVENYHSLVWKESFRSSGEFELKTHDIETSLEILPKGTLVSLRESDEVYIVTTHHIDTDEDNNDVLTISGTSLLRYILENRISWVYATNNLPDENPNAVTTVNLIFHVPDHLAFILWGGLVFPHSEGGYPNTKKLFELPFNISVPHTAVSMSIFENGDYYRVKWPAPQETRLETVTSLLELDQRYGVRSIRPKSASAFIYTPNLDSLRGEGITNEEEDVDKLLFDVYQGVDRTKDDENKVIFRYHSGDIDSAEYLSSIDGYKNFVNSYSERNSDEGVNHNRPSHYTELLWEKDLLVDILHDQHHYSTNQWLGPIDRSTWHTLNSYTVEGSGPANMRATWLFNSTPLYISRHLRAIRIMVNDRRIGYWTHGGNRVNAKVWDSSGSIINYTLRQGDVVSLEAYATASNGHLRTLSRFSFKIDPVPHEDASLANQSERKYVHGVNFKLGAVESTANTNEEGLTQENRSRIRSDGLRYLTEHKEIEIITADISPHSLYRYGEHYGLGDVVWVQGKYGSQQKMVVSEYTRTSELSGVSGYPTLVKWEEPID